MTYQTHFLENTCTLIDNIFTKLSPCSQSSTAGILFTKISDHCATFLSTHCKIDKPHRPNFITTRIYNQKTSKNFKEELESKNFQDILRCNPESDPNYNYNKLHELLTSLRDKHFPYKSQRFNKYRHKLNNWITCGILKSIKTRDKIYFKIKKKLIPLGMVSSKGI